MFHGVAQFKCALIFLNGLPHESVLAISSDHDALMFGSADTLEYKLAMVNLLGIEYLLR